MKQSKKKEKEKKYKLEELRSVWIYVMYQENHQLERIYLLKQYQSNCIGKVTQTKYPIIILLKSTFIHLNITPHSQMCRHIFIPADTHTHMRWNAHKYMYSPLKSGVLLWWRIYLNRTYALYFSCFVIIAVEKVKFLFVSTTKSKLK